MKCKHCGRELTGIPSLDREHVRLCSIVSAETRYIASGIMQEGYDEKTNTWERKK